MATYCSGCGGADYAETVGPCLHCGSTKSSVANDELCPDLWSLMDEDIASKRDDDEYRRCLSLQRHHDVQLRSRRTVSTILLT